ncbi:MAG: hypothetical protein RTV31_09670 [Candidatus Thorarchaeota archaeon]
MVKCPECNGTCIRCDTGSTDPIRNIEKKTDSGGTVLGALVGFALGGLVGAVIGAGVGSLANETYYECTRCGKRFKNLAEVKSERC